MIFRLIDELLPLFKSRIWAANKPECILPELLAEQISKLVKLPHSQFNLTFSMQGFEVGHGVSPWQGALQGCPQSFRISLQAWLPGIQNE